MTDLPLTGRRVTARDAVTNVLLRRLGADPTGSVRTDGGDAWRESGLAATTVGEDGVVRRPTGRPAELARAIGCAAAALGTQLGDTTSWPAVRLAPGAVRGRGRVSMGGRCHLMSTVDGWVALSLARTEDVELVPALTGLDDRDAWGAVAGAAAHSTVADFVTRGVELGMPVAALGEDGPARPWRINRVAATPTSDTAPRRVVNLGALWAAPLAAQVLHRAGADVVDVETEQRPDPSPAAFQHLVRAGHRRRTIDLRSTGGRRELAVLLDAADVLITASRKRAFASMGIDPAAWLEGRGSRTWVQLSAHGAESARVGFGDDAAVAGGLVAWDGGTPIFAGDALADPLAGACAGLAALACSSSSGSWHVETSLAEVARFAARLT